MIGRVELEGATAPDAQIRWAGYAWVPAFPIGVPVPPVRQEGRTGIKDGPPSDHGG